MRAIAYEGYFKQGQFYASGNAIQIPEDRRIIITILDTPPVADCDKQAAWNNFKRMVKESAHENHLLDSDAFCRQNSGRELINFADEVD